MDDDLRWNNYFSEAENRNHFILSTHENHFRKIQGRRISPKGLPVRPTTDMSKEALFNVINNHFSFEGLKILDLFSGTGNISYEFASRGSAPISVDGDFGCVKFIKQVAAEYDFIAATKSDVLSF
jgi:16S rRNA G966 N2-methylase RsmD